MGRFQRDGITAKELADLKENIKIDIKSLLCSSKEGLTGKELSREYRQLNGQNLPFDELGYNSLYDLMRNFSDVCTIQKHFSGSWIYHPIYDENTMALGKLVKGQSDKMKSKRDQSRIYEGLKANKNRYLNSNSRYESSYNSSYHSVYTQPLKKEEPIRFKSVPANIQEQISHILELADGHCLSRYAFEREYKKKNGFLFNFSNLGYSSLLEVLQDLDHLVRLDSASKDYQVDDSSDYLITLKKTNENQEQSDLIKKANILNMSLYEETIQNLNEIIKLAGPDGIHLSDLMDAYIGFTGKHIEYEKLGYYNIESLVNNKLESVGIVDSDDYEPKLVFIGDKSNNSTNDDSGQISDEESLIRQEAAVERLQELKGFIEQLLEKQNEDKIELSRFYELFEKYYGWKLVGKDYGFESDDSLLTEIVQLGFLQIDLFHNNLNKVMVLCPKREKLLVGTKSYSSSEASNEKLESIRSANAKFIQDYILYNDELDPYAVLKKLASKKTHKIVVSNVTNPCNIQIQLEENVNDLNKLMYDLEVVYEGIGASNFNMPDEYIELGHLCVAKYPGDNNWHRCRITGVHREDKKARVNYIDYGGESLVDLENLKFLSSDFSYLPVQAVNAKFANISARTDNKWSRDVIRYLLNRVASKTLIADVIGENDGTVSLEVYHYSGSTKVSINSRIIMDGQGQKCDERNEIEFRDFETWSRIIQDKVQKKTLPKKPKKLQSDITNPSISNLQDSSENKNESCSKIENISKHIESSIQNIPELLYDSSNLIKKLYDPRNKSFEPEDTTEAGEEKDQIKTKELIFLNIDNYKYYLHLFSIQNEIYVHWSEVAKIFGIVSKVFKECLKIFMQKPNRFNVEFIKIFEHNLMNDILFETIEEKLQIDLQKMHENRNEIWMIKYKHLYICADTFFDKDQSMRIKNFLKNNRISKYKERSSLFMKIENDGSQNNDVINSHDMDELNERVLANMKNLNLTNTNLNQKVISEELDRLRAECFYVRNKINVASAEKNILKCQKLINQYHEIEDKIQFFEKELETF